MQGDGMKEFMEFVQHDPPVIGMLMVVVIAIGGATKAAFEIWKHRRDA